jgi:hypothetical protein
MPASVAVDEGLALAVQDDQRFLVLAGRVPADRCSRF